MSTSENGLEEIGVSKSSRKSHHFRMSPLDLGITNVGNRNASVVALLPRGNSCLTSMSGLAILPL